jgi:DNA-binding beta-propeller fold protein YncE
MGRSTMTATVKAGQRYLRTLLTTSVIILFLFDSGLILWKIHSAFFVSVPVWQYVTIIWGVITAALAFAGGIGPGVRICRALLTGREGHEAASIDKVVLTVSRTIGTFLHRRGISETAVVLFIVIGVAVFFIPILPRLAPFSSGALAVTLGNGEPGNDKLIYVADTSNSQLIVFRSSSLKQPYTTIPIGTQGNLEGKGAPESLLELRHDRLHLVLATNTSSGKIHLVDVNSNSEIEPGLSVGKAPRSMVITPDHRKLFVSNEQTVPNAGIFVFDVSSDEPKDFHLVAKIGGVNCPEGIALSPWGNRLYVATQCGGGKDPVFIIDTANNDVIGSIPGMAVGTSVAVSADGGRLFVGRGNFPCVISETKESGSPMSVIDTTTKEVKYTICLHTSVGSMAISRPDGRYLLVANGTNLSVFDVLNLDKSQRPVNDIPLEGPVTGLGVAADNSVYGFIPTSRRVFLYSPTGLSPE